MGKKAKGSKIDNVLNAILSQFSDDELNALREMALGSDIEVNWADTHPFGMKCGSDKFYTSLCREIHESISSLNLGSGAPPSVKYHIAMMATAYFEDIMSGTRLWDAFRNVNLRLTGKKLPFFDCEHEDYLPDTINIEDLRFVVWMAFCRTGQTVDMIFSPYSDAVNIIANGIFDCLNDHIEKAPEAVGVPRKIAKVLKKADFFEVRSLCYWLVEGNPLFSPIGIEQFIDKSIDDIIFAAGEDSDLNDDLLSYYTISQIAWSTKVGPLGLQPAIYLAELSRLYGFDATAALLDDPRYVTLGRFIVDHSDEKYVYVKDVANTIYNLDRNSIDNQESLNKAKSMTGSMAHYGDSWVVNGFAILGTDEVDKPMPPMAYMTPNLRENIQKIVESHAGRRVFYFKTFDEVAELLHLKQDPEAEHDASNYVVMLSDNYMPAVLEDVAEAFSAPENPFYNPETAKDQAMEVVIYENIPADLDDHIVEHDLLKDAEIFTSQGGDLGHKLVQDNLKFLLKFYRTEAYTEK